MKKYAIRVIFTLLTCVMLLFTVSLTSYASSSTNPFTDVKKGSYYYEPVMWAIEEGITNGVSSTKFGADQTCTKAQAITFLWRAVGKPEASITEVSYNDVSKSAFYYKALLWSEENCIANGKNNVTFDPNETVTRGEFVLYLYRMMGMPSSNMKNPFTDLSAKDPYYHAVLWAVENGITNGTSATIFSGESALLRAQVVTFLWRARNMQPRTDLWDGDIYINASMLGMSTNAEGYVNTQVLQYLVNTISANGGGTIYIPSGEYVFYQNNILVANDTHCIKMASNVNIVGDGESTILKPTGTTRPGLDMFYFNNYVDQIKGYLDASEPLYLENCNFENFVVDGADAHCVSYTTAGKAFMINLFKNCNWKNMVAKNTDGTGFGVDCPIGGSMVNCVAINCGKAATKTQGGASGFGIGFGYSEDEYFTISNCESYGNKKFGYFYEHQGRFGDKYKAQSAVNLEVVDCYAEGNLYNYGGLYTMDTTYRNCVSKAALEHGYFFENSKNCKVIDCKSYEETNTSFVILQTATNKWIKDVTNIVYENCVSYDTPYGAKVRSIDSTGIMDDNAIIDCEFNNVGEKTVYTSGPMLGLKLTGNVTDKLVVDFSAVVDEFINSNNSWNN